MKRLSATDASRRFSEVLDDVEPGGESGELRELRKGMDPVTRVLHRTAFSSGRPST